MIKVCLNRVFIILASDHQEEEVEKIAAALNIDFIEKFSSIIPCRMVCLIKRD